VPWVQTEYEDEQLWKIQRLGWGGNETPNAGKLNPSSDAGLAPHLRILKPIGRYVLASLRNATSGKVRQAASRLSTRIF
jgi:hypothetical protein